MAMTLGDYRKTQKEGSPADLFLQKKIAESPNGKDEKVVACHAQVMYLLNSLNAGVYEKPTQQCSKMQEF